MASRHEPLADILGDLDRRGVELRDGGERLRFRPKSAVDAATLARLEAAKPRLLRWLRATPEDLTGAASEAYAERVSVMAEDGRLSDEQAERLALADVLDHHGEPPTSESAQGGEQWPQPWLAVPLVGELGRRGWTCWREGQDLCVDRRGDAPGPGVAQQLRSLKRHVLIALDLLECAGIESPMGAVLADLEGYFSERLEAVAGGGALGQRAQVAAWDHALTCVARDVEAESCGEGMAVEVLL